MTKANGYTNKQIANARSTAKQQVKTEVANKASGRITTSVQVVSATSDQTTGKVLEEIKQ